MELYIEVDKKTWIESELVHEEFPVYINLVEYSCDSSASDNGRILPHKTGECGSCCECLLSAVSFFCVA